MNRKTPSPDTLALLAATLVRTIKTPAKQAVEYALELWMEAREAVTLTALLKREVARRRETNPAPDILMPTRFPASLNDFLRLIVPGRNLEQRRKRYLEHLESRYEKKTAKQDLQWRDKEGFHTADEWKMEAGRFLKWWTRRKSAIATAAAKKSVEEKAAEKKSLTRKR